MLSRSSVPLFAVAALALPAAAQPPAILLTDVTAAMGIDWAQVDVATLMGAGAAFLDYDRDGWQDVLLSGGVSTPALFRNVGGTRFEKVPQAGFPRTPGWEYMCVTVADIDNDGDPDVFFGRRGPNLLFRNDGGGVFTDITTPAIAGSSNDFTTTAAFGDYDGDGNLDLYLGNYIAQFNFPHHVPGANKLFRGHGDATFTDATTPVVAGAGTALASTWTDFDADGDVDMFLCNDFGAFIEPNRVYRNDGPGPHGWQFTECSTAIGADLRIYCMGVAIGDVDRDGDFDYYFTNLGRNAFLRQDAGTFTDITAATGTGVTHDPTSGTPPLLATSWGTGFHDFDNDGWLDLYVSNGWIPADPAIANGQHTPNVLFRHDGASMTYTELPLGLDDGIGRGVAFADFDNDGDVDVLQANVDGAAVLLRNDSPAPGHWFKSRLVGRLCNRDALGARVDLELGSFTSCREVSRNYSYQSSSEVGLAFGLGTETRIRRLVARWPSGVVQQLHDLPADIALPLVEPVVTVEGERAATIRLPYGKVFVFEGTLVNHTGYGVEAWYRPEFRLGTDGARVWAGVLQRTVLGAAGRRTVTHFQYLPASASVPSGLDLDFVWAVADAGFGIDEGRVDVDTN